jgi:hypothetical protein
MKTEAFPLAPEIISGHKIGQDRTMINVSHLSLKISLLSLAFSRADFHSLRSMPSPHSAAICSDSPPTTADEDH